MKAGDRVTIVRDSVAALFPHLDTTGCRGRIAEVHPDARHPFEVWLDGDGKPLFYSAHELEVTE